MTQINRLKQLLKTRTRKGVTVRDFPTGFRLAGRIHDLRNKGWVIDTVKKEPVAVYVLKKAPIRREGL